MYTLTRKLSVVCLTVVLSFLVYGCGGSSKQATITDVSTDMVAAGLTLDSGTYTIQPGGTATAGDVTFACPAEGSSCEVTVTEADDGSTTVTSAGGMATAMTSASAEARLAALDELDTANRNLMTVQGELDTANSNLMTVQGELDTANSNLMTAQGELDTANSNLMTAQGELDTANSNLMTAQGELDTANSNLMTAQGELDTANSNLMTTQGELDTANSNLMTAQGELDTANSNLMTAQGELDTANSNLMTVQGELDTANSNLMTVQGELDTANSNLVIVQGKLDDALIAKDAAEEEARLLTTVTPIKPDLASDYQRVATTDIYKVEPGDTKAVPNSDVEINCPLEAGIRCTVVVAVNDDGVVTYTSLGGVATVANTGSVLHTRMAIALFSPNADGGERSTGGLDMEVDAAADGPPTDMIGVARSVDGSTTTFTLTHDAQDPDEVKYTDKPVDMGHGITGWIGRTLKRDNGGEDSTATREDEGTFYTNIERAKPGKWKVSGNDVPVLEMAFAVDPDQVLSNEDGATFTGAYIRADGTEIPGTYTCTTTATTCTAVGDLTTSLESQRLILAIQLAEEWKFESDNNVKEGDVADKDYMYFGYWLQEPVKQSDMAVLYKFRAYSGGPDVFSVDQALLDAADDLTATYKGGAAGRYVTRKLEFKDEIADERSPGSHGRFTATAELTAYFGAHPNFDADEDADLPNRQNMLGGSIKEFKDGDRDLDFEVTLMPTVIEPGMDVITGTSGAKFGETDTSSGSTGAGVWSANFYGPNAAAANVPATNTTLPSGVAGKFDANSKYTKVIGAFAAGKQ